MRVLTCHFYELFAIHLDRKDKIMEYLKSGEICIKIEDNATNERSLSDSQLGILDACITLQNFELNCF